MAEQQSWEHRQVYRRLDSVEKRVEGVERKHEGFLEALATLQQTIEHNGKTITELKNSVDLLRGSISDHRTDIAVHGQGNQEVGRRLGEVEDDVGTLQHHVYRWGGFGAAAVLLINLFVALIAADVISV